MKKAIRAKKKTNRSAKKHRDWSPAPPRSRGRSRSRSPPSSRRSRSGDYKKSSGSGSSYKNRKRKSSKSGGGSSSKKSKSDNHKGTILTFDDFWSNVSKTALTMVKSVGLSTDNIPSLDAMPVGGRLTHCIDNWRLVCSRKWVLDIVSKGYKIPLKNVPVQYSIPPNPAVTGQAHEILIAEAIDLKAKQAIAVVDHVEGEYISSYFAVPKPNRPDQYRPILNLKFFNDNVKKYKFKMESLSSIHQWIQPNSYCIGLDLKDAFLYIPFHKDSKKYLRFLWLRELLEWQVLVFGLTCSPRVLTQVIKPIIAFIRLTFAIMVCIYLDDMLLQAHSPETCSLHAEILCLTFMSLGWSFKWSKCSLVPSQEFHHLGFDWNTKTMTISCPQRKVEKLQLFCKSAHTSGSISVVELESLIGTMESVKPAVPLTNLHLRSLQKQLIFSKHGDRIPSKVIILSQSSLEELEWWISPTGFAANCSAPIRSVLMVVGSFLSVYSGSPQQPFTYSPLQGSCISRRGNLQRCQPTDGRIPFIKRKFHSKKLDRKRTAKKSPHKFVGAESCKRSPVIGQQWRHSPTPFRFKSSIILHSPSRRYQELRPVQRSSVIVENCSLQKPHTVDSSLAQFRREYPSRLPVPSQDDQVGVHVVKGHVQTHHGDTEHLPNPGRLCQQRDPTTSQIHVLVSRQSLSGKRCDDSSLGPRQLPVPTNSPDHDKSPEDQDREDQSCHDPPQVAISDMVASSAGDVGGTSNGAATLQGDPDNDDRGHTAFPEPSRRSSRLPEELKDFLSNHLSPATTSTYKSSTKKFELFCSNLCVEPWTCKPEIIVQFLHSLFQAGASHSAVNSARSAISKHHQGYDDKPAGMHKLICQAVRAVFRLNPPLPRYVNTYDVTIVFDYLKSLHPNSELDLKLLSLKALYLLICSSLSRMSSVALLGPHLLVYKVSMI